MAPTDYVGASWPQLCRHVDDNGLLDRWAQAEPALAGIGSLEELPAVRDAVLGALVRLAAVDGGDDIVAAQVTAHLVGTRVDHTAALLRDLAGADTDPIVAGTLWEQIRTFPWRRRHRAYATSLDLDVRKKARALICPPADGAKVTRPALMTPEDLTEAAGPDVGPPQASEPAIVLAEVLAEATAGGVISGADARFLADLVTAGAATADRVRCAQHGACTRAAARAVARQRGVSTATVLRRRDRVVRRLQAAAGCDCVDGAA